MGTVVSVQALDVTLELAQQVHQLLLLGWAEPSQRAIGGVSHLGLRPVQDAPPLRRELHEQEPAVVPIPAAPNSALLLQLVQQLGHGAGRDEQLIGQLVGLQRPVLGRQDGQGVVRRPGEGVLPEPAGNLGRRQPFRPGQGAQADDRRAASVWTGHIRINPES